MGGRQPSLDGVPYDRLALIYDAIPPGQAYQSVLHQAMDLLKEEDGIHRVLDLACGTGSASLTLHSLGYEVIGVDRSPGMIAAARRKVAASTEGLRFTEGDMRTFTLPHTVDATFCLGDALNHLLEENHVSECFCAVARALRPGGWFVFDVNTLCGLNDWDGETYVLHNEDFAYICECFLEEAVMTVNTTFFLPNPAAPDFYRHHEMFWERAWPLAWLDDQLRKAGLIPLHHWGWQTQETATERDRHVTIVARRS